MRNLKKQDADVRFAQLLLFFIIIAFMINIVGCGGSSGNNESDDEAIISDTDNNPDDSTDTLYESITNQSENTFILNDDIQFYDVEGYQYYFENYTYYTYERTVDVLEEYLLENMTFNINRVQFDNLDI